MSRYTKELGTEETEATRILDERPDVTNGEILAPVRERARIYFASQGCVIVRHPRGPRQELRFRILHAPFDRYLVRYADAPKVLNAVLLVGGLPLAMPRKHADSIMRLSQARLRDLGRADEGSIGERKSAAEDPSAPSDPLPTRPSLGTPVRGSGLGEFPRPAPPLADPGSGPARVASPEQAWGLRAVTPWRRSNIEALGLGPQARVCAAPAVRPDGSAVLLGLSATTIFMMGPVGVPIHWHFPVDAIGKAESLDGSAVRDGRLRMALIGTDGTRQELRIDIPLAMLIRRRFGDLSSYWSLPGGAAPMTPPDLVTGAWPLSDGAAESCRRQADDLGKIALTASVAALGPENAHPASFAPESDAKAFADVGASLAIAEVSVGYNGPQHHPATVARLREVIKGLAPAGLTNQGHVLAGFHAATQAMAGP